MTEDREIHRLNASSPIVSIELGIVIDVNPDSANTPDPITVIECGIVTDVNDVNRKNV
jgi:hypothetical protein